MAGKAATISCVISGITSPVKVEWLTVSNSAIYTPNPGVFNTAAKTQTATLAVKGSAVTEDKTFVCRVTSVEFPSSDFRMTSVRIHVYGKSVVSSFRLLLKMTFQCSSSTKESRHRK
jgi:hypothetical protein